MRCSKMDDATENDSLLKRTTDTLSDDLRQMDPLMKHVIELADNYQMTGDVADLEEAIRVNRQVLVATPDDDHAALPGRQLYLSYLYNDRFRKFNDISDLNTAIDLAERATELVADAPPHLTWH
ncbi:hypothetical protein IL306_004440 [Fusarium sp. DS 682]|nr:hypothetical protein IL306_004440 [Fusarium sp. DS 682]